MREEENLALLSNSSGVQAASTNYKFGKLSFFATSIVLSIFFAAPLSFFLTNYEVARYRADIKYYEDILVKSENQIDSIISFNHGNDWNQNSDQSDGSMILRKIQILRDLLAGCNERQTLPIQTNQVLPDVYLAEEFQIKEPPPGFFVPVTGSTIPRFAGVATFMRTPLIQNRNNSNLLSAVHIGILGIPWDGGTTNRAGARQGPRSVRDASTMVRNVNRATNVNPFELCNIADVGDAHVNPVQIDHSLQLIEDDVSALVGYGIHPLAVGGDHLSTLPIIRAIAKKYGRSLALIHFDAHCDTWDSYFGGVRYTHGTHIRRAVEEGIINPRKTVQIGLRGALYKDAEDSWSSTNGIREIDIDEFYSSGVKGIIKEVKKIVGSAPTYVTFDIDVLDPAYAPGTGTPEIGGLTTRDAQLLIRGLQGINMIGGDVVEVSPPYDTNGQITSIAAATLLYEMLCILAVNVNKTR
jgi:guanidinopropionase